MPGRNISGCAEMRLISPPRGARYLSSGLEGYCACQYERLSECWIAPANQRREPQFHQQPIEPGAPKENRPARITANAGKGNLDMRKLTSARATARTRKIECAVCERPIVHTRGRRPEVCSPRCRNRKNGFKRVRKALLGGGTGGATKRTKNNNETNALERAKTRSGRRIFGPGDVVAVEVFGGRTWKPAKSSSGIPIEIASLRQRALVAS